MAPRHSVTYPVKDDTPMSVLTREDRYIGCLLGLAVGDALGITLEFTTPGKFDPIDDMVGGGPFSLKPGQWTDDTSMALCLAESLIERKGFDATDQMQRYVQWWREGHLSSIGRCFDIGGTVSGSLSRFQRTGDPYAGPTGDDTAGNGSIMRLAPVPMFYADDAEKAIAKAGDGSRTTHGTQTAVDACRYMTGILVGALNGESKDTLLSAGYTPAPGSWENSPLHPKIAEIAEGSFKEKEPPAIKGTGYVVESLEAALWAFHRSEDFETGALMAVNLGQDADTTGAVYGQIAGAHYGASGIPVSWRGKITFLEMIESFSREILALAYPPEERDTREDVPLPDAAAIAKLLTYLDDLKRPIRELATEHVIPGDGENSIPNFHWAYANEVHAFLRDLYELGFAIDFDWPAWQDEAERLTTTPGALDDADLVTLMKLLTVHVRKERFSEGHLAGALEQGWLVAILERLRQLAS
jgi:ADP-ribosyl-[dinitrogen reductase] hydrolase